jgi:hypothetical protein
MLLKTIVKKRENNMVKIIANFGHLVRLAKEMSDAEISGDKELYKIKKKEHDNYKNICLKADEITVGNIDF